MKTKSKKQTKQGISLIVLVITIIVMIILAAAVILSLSSNGVIDRANEAVYKTDEKQMKTLAQTLWAEAYLEYREGDITEKELIQIVEAGLEKADKNYKEKYVVKINGAGVDLKLFEWETIYEKNIPTENYEILLAEKNLFIHNLKYRITIEGLGEVETKVVYNTEEEEIYFYSLFVIENNKMIGYEDVEDYESKVESISGNSIIANGVYVADEQFCVIFFEGATKEYTITKIEREKIDESEPWIQNGTIVTNANTGMLVNVGDYIDYVATGSDYVGDTDTWQILGAKNGQLLIVSSSVLATSERKCDSYKKVWDTIITDMDKSCLPYGNGRYATNVRSITGEDIDRIAQYDISTFKGTDAGETPAMDYGRELTYSWDSDGFVTYTYDGLATPVRLTKSHDTFIWYDEASKSWKESSAKREGVIKASDGTEAKITNSIVSYEGKTKITDKKAYALIFGTNESYLLYGLASKTSGVNSEFAGYGIRTVTEGFVIDSMLIMSFCGCLDHSIPVRAVVSLATGIDLELAEKRIDSENVVINSWNITKVE